MGRPTKKGVDYFSHDCDASGKPTLYTIQERFGNDGYAFWFKLLEFLGQRENLSFDCNVKAEWLYFVAKAKVSEQEAIDILDTLASIDAIDPELWKQKIVWSDNFLERVRDVYKKRGTTPPTKPIVVVENPHIVDEPVDEPLNIVGSGEDILPTPPEEPAKPKRKGKKSTEEIEADKVKYAELVRMKPSEYETLIKSLGKDATEKAIQILDNYKGSKGKSYKDDYRAILSWVVDKMKRECPQLIRPENQQQAQETAPVNPFASYL